MQALPAFRWLAGGLLGIAALLFLVQAWSDRIPWLRPRAGGAIAWTGALTRIFRGNAMGSTMGQRYGLGLVLGLLPCAMLYAALAAAAATGSAIEGAAAMAAFALGTAPALIAVGYAGQFFGRRWRAAAFLTALARATLA